MLASIRMDGSRAAVGRALVVVGLALATQSASAAVTHYQARAPWEAVTGAVTTIGIPNVPQTSFGMGSHFASQGVTDLEMYGIPLNDEQSALWRVPTGTVAFLADSGIWSHVQFATPIHSINDFPLPGGYGHSMSFATIVPAPMTGTAVALGLMCVGRGRRRSAR